MKKDYESLSYQQKFFHICKIAAITLLACAIVAAPLLWAWGESIEMRQTLREAKNVKLNMELLSLEYYGFGAPLVDVSRESGLSKEAEEQIRSFSAADGAIYLQSWDETKQRIIAMTYQKGKCMAVYRYEEPEDALTEESGTWTVYYRVHEYKSS